MLRAHGHNGCEVPYVHLSVNNMGELTSKGGLIRITRRPSPRCIPFTHENISSNQQIIYLIASPDERDQLFNLEPAVTWPCVRMSSLAR